MLVESKTLPTAGIVPFCCSISLSLWQLLSTKAAQKLRLDWVQMFGAISLSMAGDVAGETGAWT